MIESKLADRKVGWLLLGSGGDLGVHIFSAKTLAVYPRMLCNTNEHEPGRGRAAGFCISTNLSQLIQNLKIADIYVK